MHRHVLVGIEERAGERDAVAPARTLTQAPDSEEVDVLVVPAAAERTRDLAHPMTPPDSR